MPVSTHDADAVLDCPMGANDANAPTVRAYLAALLRELWREEDGFSGKRPFGNSSWQYQVYGALGKAGLIDASFDQDGYIDTVDAAAGDALISAAIERLAGTGSVPSAGQ